MRVLWGHKSRLRGVAFLPDASALASAGQDGMVKLWDLVTGKERRNFFAPPKRWPPLVNALAVSPDGSMLAAVGHSITMWDMSSGQERPVNAPPHYHYVSAAFSPDCRKLVVAWGAWGPPRTRGLLVWDPSTDQHHFPPWGQAVHVSALAFAPDGKVLAGGLCSDTQTPWKWFVRLWDAVTGSEQAVFPQPSPINAVAFSPDGKILAVAAGRRVRLWDVATGEQRVVLAGHARQVNSIAFTPDGRTLASGSNDKTVRLWDPATGQQRACFDWQVGQVRSVAFAPDGMTAAAVGDRRRVVVWDVDD